MKSCQIKRIGAAVLVAVMVFLLIPVGAFAVVSEETPAVWDGTAAEGFARGTGTEKDPYIIETAEQLAFLAQSNNSGTDYSGKYIKLANDIALNDTADWLEWENSVPANQWTAIGLWSKDHGPVSFEGNFDGAGHTISGIYIKTGVEFQGLFGCTDHATIKNLGIEKSYIKGGYEVGSVAGYQVYGTIENCYNTGKVLGTNCVGGVVGRNYYGTIENCYNAGKVDGAYSLFNGTQEYVGGVVAYIFSATVKNCYNAGTVVGKKKVGSVIGVPDESKVKNCYYLAGCAKDGNGTVQNGIGAGTVGETTADGSGKTTGLTKEQMKEKKSFSGFAFGSVWTIGETEGYDYPTLLSEKDEPKEPEKDISSDTSKEESSTAESKPESSEETVSDTSLEESELSEESEASGDDSETEPEESDFSEVSKEESVSEEPKDASSEEADSSASEKEESEPGSNAEKPFPWYWIPIGIILIGGGAAAFLAVKKKKS